jgi:hypothetical protein
VTGSRLLANIIASGNLSKVSVRGEWLIKTLRGAVVINTLIALRYSLRGECLNQMFRPISMSRSLLSLVSIPGVLRVARYDHVVLGCVLPQSAHVRRR